jgi:trans-AT polyketide synthase/acyltransferase/oxidoreductase domain-containing protein
VEAGTSDTVKDMLQEINIQDTAYAPAGDMFELGAKVQVMKKGVFFPARANKLYDLWRNYGSLEHIDASIRKEIQDKYFKRSFDEVYRETKGYYMQEFPAEIDKAERSPKAMMALIFRWYFVHTMRLALEGSKDQRVDYQVHTGPALGAFNQWVQGTSLQDWQNRHVDVIGEHLMQASADYMNRRLQIFF